MVFLHFAAAHCFNQKNGNYKLPPQIVTAFTGKHNINVVNEYGSKEHLVWDVILHPDWNARIQNYDADIAVVVLRDHVEFSSFISPICLPQQSDSEVFGTGFAVGWGRTNISDKSPKLSPTPNKLESSVVYKRRCLTQVPDLKYLFSNRTFCGGFFKQSKATCNGDSGGGFFILNRSSNLFTLAGVISSSLSDFFGTCDIEVYSVLTDVAKFVDWINEKVEETMEIVWKAVDFDCRNENR